MTPGHSWVEAIMKTRTGWLAAALGLTLVIGLSGAPLAAGQAADTESGFGKYRAAGGLEARLFFAMLACMANAADHKIVQRDCISFKRTDMIIAIACARLVEACQLKRRGMVR